MDDSKAVRQELVKKLDRELDVVELLGKEFLKQRNSTVVSVKLHSGEQIPEEFETMKPLSIVATDDTMTIWFLKEGHLKRIR